MELEAGWNGGIRTFTDDTGVVWEVWEAHPMLEERRRARDRRSGARETEDRRASSTDGRRLVYDSAGWLVFRSVVGMRRRHPIPKGWTMFSDDELRRMLSAGRLTGPIPRQSLPA